jgi:hypothetical protein
MLFFADFFKVKQCRVWKIYQLTFISTNYKVRLKKKIHFIIFDYIGQKEKQ